MSIRCAAGFHDDGTDVLGGYSHTCLRCGSPVIAGPTATFRGCVMAGIGVVMIFLALAVLDRRANEVTALVCGSVLFLAGITMIWTRKP